MSGVNMREVCSWIHHLVLLGGKFGFDVIGLFYQFSSKNALQWNL